MIVFGKKNNNPLKSTKGFTFIEVVVVVAMISVLSSIAMSNFIPIRKKALDSIALADARHLVDVIIDATLSDDDIDYSKGAGGFGDGGKIGELDTGGLPRSSVFELSHGVRAIITGSSSFIGDFTVVSAFVYHIQGTDHAGASNLDGKKEYFISIDERTGQTILPF